MEEIKYTGKVTGERLAQMKVQHGNVFEIEVPVNDAKTEIAVGYFKPFDRTLMGAYLNRYRTDEIAAKEMAMNALWIEGDRSILDIDEFFFSASMRIDDMISFRKAVLKKN